MLDVCYRPQTTVTKMHGDSVKTQYNSSMLGRFMQKHGPISRASTSNLHSAALTGCGVGKKKENS